MGYTHRWYRRKELALHEWKPFVDDWLRVYGEVLLRPGIRLTGPDSRAFPIVIHEAAVAFNGDPGWESFEFERIANPRSRSHSDPNWYFSSCKTLRYPYDLAVASCLIVAKRHFGASLVVCPDTRNERDWDEARLLCLATVGYGPHFTIGRDPAFGTVLEESPAAP